MKQKETFDKAVNDLQIQLQELDRDYLLVNRVSPQRVHIKFIGHFQEQQLVWNATIRTMYDYYETELKQSSDDGVELRQFIDIEKRSDGCSIGLVLNLDKVDEAGIKKSIIMVRNYKRLSLGRHEYGEVQYYNNDSS